MKISSLFIANLAEVAEPIAHTMSAENRKREIYEDHALCDRFLFSSQDNRIVILPHQIEESFIGYNASVMGYTNTHILSLRYIHESMSQAILNDNTLLKKIVKIIEKNPGIAIYSYAATDFFCEFMYQLQKKNLRFTTPEMPIAGAEWTVPFFGSKSGFRQLAQSIPSDAGATPLPGAICVHKEDVIGWAEHFCKTGDGCVIKMNRGLAGAGLSIIESKKVRKITVKKWIEHLWKTEPHWNKADTIVVEKLALQDKTICGGDVSAEFFVTNKGVHHLYDCGMRVTPEGIFQGVEFGRDAVPADIHHTIAHYGLVYAKYIHAIGYRGFFDMDWVVSQKRKLYPLETNIRRTGGTHAYEILLRLLGKNAFKTHYVVSVTLKPITPFKRSFLQLQKMCQSVLYPIQGKNEGIVITITSLLSHGYIGYCVIAKTKERAYEIEKQLLTQLE